MAKIIEAQYVKKSKKKARSAKSSSIFSPRARATHYWQELYNAIVDACGAPGSESFDEQILGDVKRTFGRSARHNKSKKRSNSIDPYEEIDLEIRRAALLNVLRAFSKVHNDVGYCQGQVS